jgi:phosphate butyryltransferase
MPINSLEQLVSHVKESGLKKKVAVAWAQDENTLGAIAKAVKEGFLTALMVGDREKITTKSLQEGIDPSIFEIVDVHDEWQAAQEAVRMVKSGEADILMKGLVGTDKFLKAVLDKEKGLLPPKAVMTYVCAIQVPAYHKLMFISDPAVIPFPDLNQKMAMISYSVTMARKFGIEKPKVALISAVEKVSDHFPSHSEYAMICRMAERGQIKNCTVDGPIDIFLACDKKSIEIKGVPTPVDGDADILIFPSIETANAFYKGLMLFAGGELAGYIQGTEKPVVMMSRSESSLSKFYCIAIACLMA